MSEEADGEFLKFYKFYSYEWTVENLNPLSRCTKSLTFPIGVNEEEEFTISISLSKEGLIEIEIKIVSNEDTVKDNCFALAVLDKTGNVLEAEHGSIQEVPNYFDDVRDVNSYAIDSKKGDTSDYKTEEDNPSCDSFLPTNEIVYVKENDYGYQKENIYGKEKENNDQENFFGDKIVGKEISKREVRPKSTFIEELSTKDSKLNFKNVDNSAHSDYLMTKENHSWKKICKKTKTLKQPSCSKQSKKFSELGKIFNPSVFHKPEMKNASNKLEVFKEYKAETNIKSEVISTMPCFKILEVDKKTEEISAVPSLKFSAKNTSQKIAVSKLKVCKKKFIEKFKFDANKSIFQNTFSIRCGLGIKFQLNKSILQFKIGRWNLNFSTSNKQSPQSLQNLSNDLERTFKENIIFSDAISQVNYKTFKAYKALIFCRCPSLLSNFEDSGEKSNTEASCNESKKIKFCIENLYLKEGSLSSKYLLKDYISSFEDERFEAVNEYKNNIQISAEEIGQDSFSITTGKDIISTNNESNSDICEEYSYGVIIPKEKQIVDFKRKNKEFQDVKHSMVYENKFKLEDDTISDNSFCFKDSAESVTPENLEFQGNNIDVRNLTSPIDIKTDEYVLTKKGYNLKEKLHMKEEHEENRIVSVVSKAKLPDCLIDKSSSKFLYEKLQNSINCNFEQSSDSTQIKELQISKNTECYLSDTTKQFSNPSVISDKPYFDFGLTIQTHSSHSNFEKFSKEKSVCSTSSQPVEDEIERKNSIIDLEESEIFSENEDLCITGNDIQNENSSNEEKIHESDYSSLITFFQYDNQKEIRKISATSVSSSSSSDLGHEKRSNSNISDDTEDVTIIKNQEQSHNDKHFSANNMSLFKTEECEEKCKSSLSGDSESIYDDVQFLFSPLSVEGDSSSVDAHQLNESELNHSSAFMGSRNSSFFYRDSGSNSSVNMSVSPSSERNENLYEEQEGYHTSCSYKSINEEESSIRIKDIDPHAFYWILRYIYSEKLDLNNPFLFQFTCFRVYKYAVKYGLTQLARLLAPQTTQVKTIIKKENISFMWTIQNYVEWMLYESPNFVTGSSKIIWNLFLHKDQNILILKLRRKGELESNIQYSFTLRIQENNKIYNIKSKPQLFNLQNETVIPDMHFDLNKLRISTKNIELLNIYCSIVLEVGHFITECKTFYPSSVSELNPVNLSKDLGSLFISKKYSDVSLRAGNQLFHAHKFILTSRSSTFATLLNKSDGNVLDIENIDGSTLESLLEFIYTGEVKDSQIDWRLYEAAINYSLRDLEKICRLFISTHLSGQDVCKVLLLADKVSDFELKSLVKAYVYRNASNILLSPSGLDLMTNHTDIVKEILNELSSFVTK